MRLDLKVSRNILFNRILNLINGKIQIAWLRLQNIKANCTLIQDFLSIAVTCFVCLAALFHVMNLKLLQIKY